MVVEYEPYEYFCSTKQNYALILGILSSFSAASNITNSIKGGHYYNDMSKVLYSQ